MRTLVLTLIVGLMAAPPCLSADEPDPSISWVISLDGRGKSAPFEYPDGDIIPIRLVITNTGSLAKDVRLKDHDAYHGTLSYPLEISAHVVDASRKTVTNYASGTNPGWWTWYITWSTFFEPEMPGDVISLPPGKSVTRIIPLRDVLRGCPGLKAGLPKGKYSVQLRGGEYLTNVLSLTIGAPK